jgi:hypothetical protein
MSAIDQTLVLGFLSAGETASTAKAKGDALEDLICHVFSTIPGISVTKRNQRNAFDTEEIDIAFFNEQIPGGLPFLPCILLVECKNWSSPVGSEHISWFDTKVRQRGLDFGIFVAMQGITGNSQSLTAAHLTIAQALHERRRLVVITRKELLGLKSGADVVLLLKEKLCQLAVSGSIE